VAALDPNIQFQTSDLGMIFRAMGAEQVAEVPNYEIMTLDDFAEWAKPGLPMLL